MVFESSSHEGALAYYAALRIDRERRVAAELSPAAVCEDKVRWNGIGGLFIGGAKICS
jgi:hypothetical protein